MWYRSFALIQSDQHRPSIMISPFSFNIDYHFRNCQSMPIGGNHWWMFELVVVRSASVGIDDVSSAAVRRSWSFRDGKLPQRWLPTVAASQLPWWTVSFTSSPPPLLPYIPDWMTVDIDLILAGLFIYLFIFRFAVMACCWIANPSKRPTFLQLLACLQDFYTALGHFI